MSRSQEKADKHIGHPRETDEGLDIMLTRKGFKDGYDQGVNEVLTWENLKRLDELMTEVWKETDFREPEEYYTEVSKRFKKENDYE